MNHAAMGEDDLVIIFRSELDEDLPYLDKLIRDRAAGEIKAFAHKYKVRLQYLGFQDCYELCLAIEQDFRYGVNNRLLLRAADLLEGLKAIN